MIHLSSKDLEATAQRVFSDYCSLKGGAANIWNVDPKFLLEELLGLRIGYARLSPSLDTLGVTSFCPGDEVQIFDDPDDDEATFVFDGFTVLIESELTKDKRNRGRLNFTMVHEGCHHILNRLYPGQQDVSEGPHFYKVQLRYERREIDWVEWQTNTLASALLMPKELIDKAMFYMNLGDRIERLNSVFEPDVYERFICVADLLGVSARALDVRMGRLGLIKEDYFGDPYRLIRVD